MAEPLAIEGHRKLEAAQQELFDAFSACYKKVNGRLTEGWQPHEMIMLCNDACFFDLVEAIREEIEHLTGEQTEPVSDVSGVLALIQARDMYLEVEFDLNAETLSDPLFRTQVLGELLVDLQSCRIEQRKFCTTDLRLELTDKIGQEARPLISEIAQVFDVKATGSRKGGKGAYKGKGGTAAGGAAPGGDERAQILDQVADVVAADEQIKSAWPEHLLYPEWNMDSKQEDAVNSLIGTFNKEYTARRKVLTRRLDVTIQAFLWSPKADKYSGQISQAIAAVMDWRDHLGSANIGKWHMFATDHNITEAPTKVSSITSISSMVKSVIIGAVPDRGGVPEGYTVEDIAKDIVKANVALTRKDAGGGGKGASAQAAAALSAKRWVGQGMGGGEGASYQDTGGAAAGGGGGGAYYSKGAGGKGGDKGGGGGYYGSKDGGKGGGGGGYYSQQASGGGGGYYSQGSGKDGGAKGGGGKDGGKDGGGGYYSQQSAGSSAGGGGGGGGGFYAQRTASTDAGGGGGGGFYAQQREAQTAPAAGGFYAQQAAGSGGGGGFYAQQQQQQNAGGGGFYAQQSQAGGGGGGFYAQQDAPSAGGFYAQQQQQAPAAGGFYAQGGGGGGFYDQQGGRGGGRGGGGGWGGRDTDRPATAKGWSKGQH